MLFEAVYDVSPGALDFAGRVAAGFRAVSLSAWFDGGLRCAVVWRDASNLPLSPPQTLVVGAAGDLLAHLASGTYKPELVSAVALPGPLGLPGPAGALFALVTRKDPSYGSRLVLDVPDGAGLLSWAQDALAGTGPFKAWQILLSASLYQHSKGYAVAAITGDQGGWLPGGGGLAPRINWGFHVASAPGETEKAVTAYKQHSAIWPIAIQPLPFGWSPLAPSPRSLTLVWENSIGPWEGLYGLTAAQLQANRVEQGKLGRFLIRLHGARVGGVTRYGAVFAQDDAPLARKFQVHRVGPPPVFSSKPAWLPGGGLPPPPSFIPMVDGLMKFNMQAYNVRSAHLALGRAGKLVYAAGYTFAEPGHPIAKPTTLTRVMSVTKVLTKVAVLQGLAYSKGGAINLNSDVYPHLAHRDDLQACRTRTLTGGVPPSAYFREKLTVAHLLRHTARFKSTKLTSWSETRLEIEDANAFLQASDAPPCQPTHLSLPFDEEQLERVQLGFSDEDLFEPGGPLDAWDDTNRVYSNKGYFLLGRLVEVIGRLKSGLESGPRGRFLEAEHFRTSIMDPLGIPEARWGIAQMGQPSPKEAFSPPDNLLLLRRSEVEADALALESYYWNLAHGGSGYGNLVMTLAAAVRILTAFDLQPCPLLPDPWLTIFWSLMDDAGTLPDENGNQVALRSHGGVGDGARGGVVRRMDGGFSAAVIFNRGKARPTSPNGFFVDLNAAINASVADGSFPDYDLFPQLEIG